MKILVINGPNLNMLGTREPEIYGCETLDDINKELSDFSKTLSKDIEIDFYQSNTEGEIIDKIQNSKKYKGLIINPAAYTHTSIAIADAIKGAGITAVEVHLSNIHAREDFRHTSLIAPVCMAQISGFGFDGYKLGLKGLVDFLKSDNSLKE